MTISDLIEQLKHFSTECNISEIIRKLSALPQSSNAQNEVELLRKKLQLIVADPGSETKIIDELNLKAVAYNCLIALAETYPLNELDPVTLGTIAAENRIVISVGRQYDLPELISYHKKRPLRNVEGSPESNGKNKLLLDPVTNLPFLKEDADHIKIAALTKNIPLSLSIQEIELLVKKAFLREQELHLQVHLRMNMPFLFDRNNNGIRQRLLLSYARLVFGFVGGFELPHAPENQVIRQAYRSAEALISIGLAVYIFTLIYDTFSRINQQLIASSESFSHLDGFLPALVQTIGLVLCATYIFNKAAGENNLQTRATLFFNRMFGREPVERQQVNDNAEAQLR